MTDLPWLMRRLPVRDWAAPWKGKLKRMWNLAHHTAAEHQDEFWVIKIRSHTRPSMPARYELKPFRGQVLNVIRSKHP